MATFVKTIQTPLLSLQGVSTISVVNSSAVNTSTKLGGLIQARFGRRAATAATAGINLRLESSSLASGDNSWFPFTVYTSNFATCIAKSVTGLVSSTNVITTPSTTSLAVGDIIYIDNTTFGNGEWARIKAISTNSSVTVEDQLVNAQTGSIFYNAAEIYTPVTIPEGSVRIRIVDDGSAFNQNHAIEVNLITIDSIA